MFRISLIIFCILLQCLMSGCGGSSGSSSENTLKIGVLNTETGGLASIGPAISSAMRLAEAEINQQLADQGSDFEVTIEMADTRTDPQGALEQLKVFNEKGIKVVIGPMSSAEALALRQFSLENGIVLISPSSTAVGLEQSDDLLLRLTQNDRGQANAMTQAFRYFKTKFYVPVWRADQFGDDLVGVVGKRFIQAGGNFAPGSRYAIETADFSSALHQLEIQLDAYIDFFGRNSISVYAVSFDEIRTLLKEAHDKGGVLRMVRWYGSDDIALNYELLEDPAVVEFMTGTNMLSPIFAGDFESAEFVRIRSAIESEVGHLVRPYAILAYDAVALAVKAVQSLDNVHAQGTELRDAIIKLSTETVGASGSLALNPSGDRESGSYEFWRIVRNEAQGPYWQRGGTYRPNTGAGGGVFIPE